MLTFAVLEPITPGIEHCALKKWATGASKIKMLIIAGFEPLTPKQNTAL